jgi:hypothetical protein
VTERMEKMAEENPVMEEPVEEPTTPEVSAEDSAKSILEELSGLGIDSVEKVQNMATASSESGNLAQMLGEVRQQNQDLQRQITEIGQPRPQENMGYEDQSQDIAGIMRKEIRNFYSNEIVKPQVEQTNRVYGELSSIQSDEDYAMVQPVWDQHWNSPQTQHRIMTGQASPRGEYDKVVKTYYRSALKKTHGALRGVMETKAKPPHVEVGDQTHVDMPTQLDVQTEQVKGIIKNNKGGDGDIEALVKAFLPADAFKT